jgi:hypothetical protein
LEVELNLALGNGEWSASHPCCFTLDKEPWYIPQIGPGWVAELVWMLSRKENSLASARNRTTIPWSSRSRSNRCWFCSCHCCRWYYYYYSLGHRQNNPEIGARSPPGSSPNHPDRHQGPFPCRRGGVENYTSTFPYAFLVSCSIMHMDNITQCYRDSNY